MLLDAINNSSLHVEQFTVFSSIQHGLLTQILSLKCYKIKYNQRGGHTSFKGGPEFSGNKNLEPPERFQHPLALRRYKNRNTRRLWLTSGGSQG